MVGGPWCCGVVVFVLRLCVLIVLGLLLWFVGLVLLLFLSECGLFSWGVSALLQLLSTQMFPAHITHMLRGGKVHRYVTPSPYDVGAKLSWIKLMSKWSCSRRSVWIETIFKTVQTW